MIEYRHITGGSQQVYTFPVTFNEADLAKDEWLGLDHVADAIDRAARVPEPASVREVADDCWAAYCYAVGLPNALRVGAGSVTRAVKIDSVKELVGALRNRSAAQPTVVNRSAPPLIRACCFLTGLTSPAYASLASWCTGWGENSAQPWRQDTLDKARRDAQESCAHYRASECLSIIILSAEFTNDARGHGDGDSPECSMMAMLATVGGPATVLESQLVTGGEQVIGIVQDLIGSVEDARIVPLPDDMLLEFVLPRNILARRLEYEGLEYEGMTSFEEKRIVIRDLELIRDRKRRTARGRAAGKFARIRSRDPGLPWSAHIKWLDCAKWADVGSVESSEFFSEENTFVLAIPHVYQHNGRPREDWRPSGALEYSVDAGSPIIMSLHPPCNLCLSREPNSRLRYVADAQCGQDFYKAAIERVINNQGLGPADLPLILRTIRADSDSRGLKIGTVMFGDRPGSPYLALTSAAAGSEN